MSTDISHVTDFIYQAGEDDLETIREAMKVRHRMIGLARAAGIALGDVVTLINLSPKALNGLTGTISEFTSRNHVTVRLDEDSTQTLRWSRTRFSRYIPTDTEEYLLTGIPAACCLKNEVVA